MKTFGIITLLLAVVSATPVDIVDKDVAAPLEKRDTEVVYLTNCISAVSCCTPTEYYSQISYYPTSASSQNGAVPDPKNRCTTSGSSFTTWEGAARSCTFSTGITYTSHIDAGAQSRADFSYAGTGYNGKNWNCYKDNGRTLFDPYMPEASNSCKSVYYCLPK